MQPASYETILRRFAYFLFAVFLIDVAVFAYCIANRINFASSVGAVALISSVLLWRRSLRTAAVLRWISLFAAGYALPALLAFPLIVPLDLLRLYVRLEPTTSLVVGAYSLALVALFAWTARTLSSASVTAAQEARGRRPARARFPFGIGFALGLGLTLVITSMMHGPTAAHAERLAEEQRGPDYRYRLIALSTFTSGGETTYFATVAAWNDHEVNTDHVRWNER